MKLAVLSNDRLNPWINWSTLGPPLLSALTRLAGGTLVSPPPLSWSERRDWIRTLQDVRRADTLFWMQGSARPELPIIAASFAAGFARRSAFVVDAWKPALPKIGLAAVAQRLDPCFVAFREGCEELKRLFPKGRFEWLPFGIDTQVFDAVRGERDIFAFWMGRRHAPLHEALLRYCEARGLTYCYRRDSEFLTPDELGRLAGRARYFVVTPPDLDDVARTGGYSPLVMRYLEGLSAGARLLGVMPKSGEYQDLLPRAAILEVAPDGSDLESSLDADLANQEGWSAVEHATSLVRAHHSWERRAEQIRDRLAFNAHVDLHRTAPIRPSSPATAGVED